MPKLTIDATVVDAAPGSTVLDAARTLGIEIPTMCFRPGCAPFTSCMVCVVRNGRTGALIPSCAAPAQEGMVIDTRCEEVQVARRDALELLLSEHVGDCEGPCRLTCPAHMDIPLMIRQIRAGRFREALATVKEHIALPAVLGRICPAPCEKGCRRAQHDGSVSICLLKRFVADLDLNSGAPCRPPCSPASGRTVAICGAGPAGLAAAYHLLRQGHACTLYDRQAAPGGALRTGLPRGVLPLEVLDAEVATILRMGARFCPSTRIGGDIALSALREQYDAVVLATGADALLEPGLTTGERGIQADHETMQTSIPGVFAGGAAIHPTRMAVRAVADGRALAETVDRFLRTGQGGRAHPPFNSRIGRLQEGEMQVFLKEAVPGPRHEPQAADAGFSAEEAVSETARCLRCDCRKPDSCLLRRFATAHEAHGTHYRGDRRAPFEQRADHPDVVFEPGKCIKCGLCVQITAAAGEPVGLAFVGRGYDVRVGPPAGESLASAVRTCAAGCVQACPTGALAWKDRLA